MKKELIIENEVVIMSFDEVLNKFTPAIHKEIKKQKVVFDRPSEERDDLFQNASVWLWKAFEKYDISKKTHFSTLAFPYIKKGIQQITEKNNTDKRGIVDYTISIDKTINENEDSLYTLLHDEGLNIENDLIVKDILNTVVSQLTDKETEALEYMLEGRHSTELAEKYNITRQCTASRYRRVRSKFLKIYNNMDTKGETV